MGNSLRFRFWSKVDMHGPNGCWLWLGCKNALGYGRIWNPGGSTLAHRVAHELTIGPIPEGFQIDHACHNPSCVNPGHQRIATNGDNQHNQNLSKRSTTGLKGVSWCPITFKWRASINIGKVNKNLGRFLSPEEAYSAYCKAASELFGEFANFGQGGPAHFPAKEQL